MFLSQLRKARHFYELVLERERERGMVEMQYNKRQEARKNTIKIHEGEKSGFHKNLIKKQIKEIKYFNLIKLSTFLSSNFSTFKVESL